MPDPRHTLRDEWPRVRIFVRYMPDRWGMTTWTDDGGAYIELAHDLDAKQQTFTLAHELGHLVAGKPCRSFCEVNEQQVIEWTARYLIPDMAKLGALLAEHDIAAAADALMLPVGAVTDRLAYLTPVEREQLGAALRAAQGDGGLAAAMSR